MVLTEKMSSARNSARRSGKVAAAASVISILEWAAGQMKKSGTTNLKAPTFIMARLSYRFAEEDISDKVVNKNKEGGGTRISS